LVSCLSQQRLVATQITPSRQPASVCTPATGPPRPPRHPPPTLMHVSFMSCHAVCVAGWLTGVGWVGVGVGVGGTGASMLALHPLLWPAHPLVWARCPRTYWRSTVLSLSPHSMRGGVGARRPPGCACAWCVWSVKPVWVAGAATLATVTVPMQTDAHPGDITVSLESPAAGTAPAGPAGAGAGAGVGAPGAIPTRHTVKFFFGTWNVGTCVALCMGTVHGHLGGGRAV
jgi:hypothetical protein